MRFFSKQLFCALFLPLCLIFWVPGVFSNTQNSKELIVVDKTRAKYSAGSFRDPFASQLPVPVQEEEVKPKVDLANLKEAFKKKPKASELFKFSISGIIWNSSRPTVIINNEVLEVGGVLVMSAADAKDSSEFTERKVVVEKIEKDGVTISYSGQKEKLSYP